MNISRLELALIRGLTRRFPRIKQTDALAYKLSNFLAYKLSTVYTRKQREFVYAEFRGFKMKLDPNQLNDAGILFYPQFVDPFELDFVVSSLRPGETFVDAGAYIGTYSLPASRAVGTIGTVVAIEADLYSYDILRHNLDINGAENVVSLNIGLSDRVEVLSMTTNTKHRATNTFLPLRGDGEVTSQCRPLLEILVAEHIDTVDGLKVDLEGMEYKVLAHFFLNAPSWLYPKFIIVEYQREWEQMAGGNAIELLVENGYRVYWCHGINYIMTRS